MGHTSLNPFNGGSALRFACIMKITNDMALNA